MCPRERERESEHTKRPDVYERESYIYLIWTYKYLIEIE